MNIIKTTLLVLIFTALFLSSCLEETEYRTSDQEAAELETYLEENEITTEPTWTGLYYIESEAGSGDYPVYYDTVVVNYSATTLDGTFLGSSDSDGELLSFIKGSSSTIYGLSEAIGYMQVGAKATAIIPSDLAYSYYSYGDIDPYTTLIYELELKNIKPGITVEPYDTSKMTLHTTSSGLQYYIVEENDSTEVTNGVTVSIDFSAYFEDGTLFNSSLKRGEASEYSLGGGYLIDGLEEGLVLMKIGEKFRFIIPSGLAYGENGYYPIIPPDETIIFDIEILDIL